MSYCRLSSDNFRCDVYVYGSETGWVTHVAGRQYAWPLLPSAFWAYMAFTRWAGVRWDTLGPRRRVATWGFRLLRRIFLVWERLQTLWQSWTPLVPIRRPHAGQAFCDPTPQACADRLVSLRALGYRIPDAAIRRLRDEDAS